MKKIIRNWQKILSVFVAVLILVNVMPTYASEEQSEIVSGVEKTAVQSNDENTVENTTVETTETQTIQQDVENQATNEGAEVQSQEQTTENQAVAPAEQQGLATTMLRGLRTLGGGVGTLGDPAHGDLRIQLALKNMLPDRTLNDDSDFWVTDPINAVADISVTGTNGVISDPWVLITVPRSSEDKISKPIFMVSEVAYQSVAIEQPDAYYMLYKFDRFDGGTKMTFPYPFTFLRTANQGDTVTPTLKVFNASGVANKQDRNITTLLNLINTLPVLEETQKDYKALKQEIFYADTGIYFTGENRKEKIDPSNSSELNNTIYVYDHGVDVGATDSGLSSRFATMIFYAMYELPTNPSGRVLHERPENIVAITTLPEGMQPQIDATNSSWVSFDPITRQMTLKMDNPSVTAPTGPRTVEGYSFPNLKMTMQRQALNTRIDLNTKFYVNYGTAEQRELPERVVPVKFNPIPFTQGYGFARYKDNLPNNYAGTTPIAYSQINGEYTIVGDRLFDRMYDQTDNGLFYASVIANTNNGSSSENMEDGRQLEVKRIVDYLYTDQAGDYGFGTDATNRRTYYKYFTIGEVRRHGDFFGDVRAEELKNEVIQKINTTPNVLYGVKLDGTKVELKRNLQYQEKFEVNDTAQQYVRLELEFSEPIRLNNTAIWFYTQTMPTPSEVQKFIDKTYTTKQTYHGKIGAEYRVYNGKTGVAGNYTYTMGLGSLGFTSIEPISPLADLFGKGDRTVNFRAGGTMDAQYTDIRFRSTTGQWGALADRPVENVKLVELLPSGFTYSSYQTTGHSGTVAAPEIVEDYKGTGRQAVIYTIPQFIPNDTSMRDIRITTISNIPKEAKTTGNIIDSYLIYPNNHIIKPNILAGINPAYVDALDLDDDGDVTEIFMHRSANINYIAPLELMIKKQVGFTKNSLGTMATGDLGEEFVYNINIYNNTLVEIDKATILDSLPYIGDHNIVSDRSGNYLPRDSKYPISITKAIEDVPENAAALSRFNIFYQLTPQPATTDALVNGSWVTKDQVSDFSQVKSFKIELKAGAKILQQEEINFLISAKMPSDTSLNDGDLATNTVAVSTNGVTYVEGSKVSVTFQRYNVSGVAFNDVNDNGTRDANEEGLAGIPVELIYLKKTTVAGVEVVTEEIATDIDGNQLVATTDENGAYSFEVFKRGDYKVRFGKRPSTAFSQAGTGNNANHVTDTSILTGKGTTTTATLNPSRRTAIRNAGIAMPARDVTIYKISTDRDQQGNEIPLRDVVFKVQKDGETTSTEYTTNAEGKILIQSLPYGRYTITEIRAPRGYEMLTPSKVVEISPTTTLDGLKVLFENKFVSRSVSFKKVDVDTNAPIEGVKFTLREIDTTATGTDPVFTTVQHTATSDAQGNVVFENVLNGTYMVIEDEVQPHANMIPYNNERYSTRITLSGLDNTTHSLANVTNEKIKRNIKMTKVDADDNSVVLAGVVFELKQGNTVIQTKTTGNDGVVLFENVPYGEYKVVEKTPLSNYNHNNTEISVTVNNTQPSTIELANFANQMIKGNVKIKKVDANNQNKTLQGVEFVVRRQDNSGNYTVEVERATTNAVGEITFANLRFGRYQVVETRTLRGYDLNTTPIEINIRNNGETIERTVTNTPNFGTVKVTKTDREDTNIKLQGIEFTLYEQDGTTEFVKPDGNVYKVNTDQNGIATFTDVPVGNYKLIETRGLSNYILDDTPIDVSIQNNGQVVEKTHTNLRIKKGIKLTKVDFDNENKKLQGVVFDLKQGSTVIDTKTTDFNGEVLFSEVSIGSYQVVERQALEGYIANNNPITVTIDANSPEFIDLGVVKNKQKTGKIRIIKVDGSDENIKIPYVIFELRKGAEVIRTRATNRSGILEFDNVPFGNYQVVEVVAPSEYSLNPTPIEVSITNDGEVVEKTVRNSKVKGHLEVEIVEKVVDSATGTISYLPIPNAKFELKLGTNVIQEVLTGPDGKIRVANLALGQYTLLPILTPPEYEPMTDEIPVVLTRDGQTVQVYKEYTRRNNPTPPLSNYDLTTSVNGGNGSISASKTNIPSGTTEIVTFTPDTNYEIDYVTLDGANVTSQVSNNQLSVLINANRDVVVKYRQTGVPPTQTYTLTTSVNGGNGAISAGDTNIPGGTTKEVTFIPNTGYEIESVTLDGVDVTSSLVGNKLNVVMNADRDVIVKYKQQGSTPTPPPPVTYTLTTNVNGGNGSISASKTNIPGGTTEIVTFTPNTNYEIDYVTLDGADVTSQVSNNQLSVLINADKNVVVKYKQQGSTPTPPPPITYTLTTSVNGGNGSISTSKTNIPGGTMEIVTFNPATNYEIDYVTVNGADVTSQVLNNQISLLIDGNKDVVVKYRQQGSTPTPPPPPLNYDLTTSVDGGNGSISTSKTNIPGGTTEIVIFTPDTNYEIDYVTVNGVNITSAVLNNQLSLLIDADKDVVVKYRQVSQQIDDRAEEYDDVIIPPKQDPTPIDGVVPPTDDPTSDDDTNKGKGALDKDTDTAKKDSRKKAPKTGDNLQIVGYAAMAGLSAMLLAKKRRKDKNSR